ncbi:MAG: hypothetical protein R3242_06590 [Akkermansiaceae bacterium]|nr:hypothetical protein [Akkermansiaceae bacterium]
MKRRLLALLLLPTFAQGELRVHEWGTFTTFSNSRGTVMHWYSPFADPSVLPAFVQKGGAFMKGMVKTPVRMETPVLYFYPDEPMEVDVEAWYMEGSITEFYPATVPNRPERSTDVTVNRGFIMMPARWKGRLLPPNDKKALSMIPAVSSDDRGAHYAAAREVPDAWIFHHQTKFTDPETREVRIEDQADKFIFYRGAGFHSNELWFTNLAEDEIQVTNIGEHVHAHGVLLEVRGQKARWSKLPSIAARVEKLEPISTSIQGDWLPLDEAESQLSGWFQSTLTSEGLSEDEAAAMIATWHGTWFREPGLRAFTLMPRAQVDAILPLDIQPAPTELVRVFVNRHEMLSASKEEELATLIHDTRIPDLDAHKRLEALELGRFEPTALERALDVGRNRMHERYSEIRHAKKAGEGQ